MTNLGNTFSDTTQIVTTSLRGCDVLMASWLIRFMFLLYPNESPGMFNSGAVAFEWMGRVHNYERNNRFSDGLGSIAIGLFRTTGVARHRVFANAGICGAGMPSQRAMHCARLLRRRQQNHRARRVVARIEAKSPRTGHVGTWDGALPARSEVNVHQKGAF